MRTPRACASWSRWSLPRARRRRPGRPDTYNPRNGMSLVRALAYFFEEALQSLWRSRLISVLSVGTIAVSLFVLGAFLTIAANLSEVVTRWTQKVQVTLYLEDRVEARIARMLADRLRDDPAVETLVSVGRDEARERFRALFRDLRALPEELGANPFPASFEITLKPSHQTREAVERFVKTYEKAPGVEEVQYDLLWIQRLSTAVRLVRGIGAFLGAILALA